MHDYYNSTNKNSQFCVQKLQMVLIQVKLFLTKILKMTIFASLKCTISFIKNLNF